MGEYNLSALFRVEDGRYTYLEIYELGAKGLSRLRKGESEKHRLVTE